MSNFNTHSPHFNPTIFPNGDYSKVRLMSNKDIVDTIESSCNIGQINQSYSSNIGIANHRLVRNPSSKNRQILDKLRKSNTKDEQALLSPDRICDTKEKEIVKYGFENLPTVIDKLISDCGIFSIITDKRGFDISLDTGSIPHILALLNVFDIKNGNNETRLYIEAKERLTKLGKLPSSLLKVKYLEIIRDIIDKYKDKLLHTYANPDDYSKDLFVKISYKVCAFEYLFKGLLLNSINNIEIFNGNRNGNKHLLVMPIDNRSYIYLKLTKNEEESTYTIESSGLLLSKEYHMLDSFTQFGDTWKKAGLSIENFVFKKEDNPKVNKLYEARNKVNSRFESRIDRKEYRIRIREQFNELISRNDSYILEEIHNLLLTSDNDKIKEELPLILIKLYQNYRSNNKSLNDEDYYKTLMILAYKFSGDKDVMALLDACYSNDLARIKELIEVDNYSSEIDSSIVISRTDNSIYLDISLGINSDLLTLSYSTLDQESFDKKIESINKQLVDTYRQIQEIKINNIEDARKYIVLMNDYFNIYSTIQTSISNLYSSYMSKSITVDKIISLAANYPDVFEYLTNLGISKQVGDYSKLDDIIEKEEEKNKDYKGIIDEITTSGIEYTIEMLGSKLLVINNSSKEVEVIDIIGMKLIKDIISQLNKPNYEDSIQTAVKKLRLLIEIKEEYYGVKTLEKVG